MYAALMNVSCILPNIITHKEDVNFMPPLCQETGKMKKPAIRPIDDITPLRFPFGEK